MMMMLQPSKHAFETGGLGAAWWREMKWRRDMGLDGG